MGCPCDSSVSPSPFDLDFGTLDFGTSDLGLTNTRSARHYVSASGTKKAWSLKLSGGGGSGGPDPDPLVCV